jgi:mersacidin/lichenicidin family type 2 lantibiotic
VLSSAGPRTLANGKEVIRLEQNEKVTYGTIADVARLLPRQAVFEEEEELITMKEETMTHLNIIRAWKDEEYRLSLSEAERALLPAHPVGLIALLDDSIATIEGGECLYFPEVGPPVPCSQLPKEPFDIGTVMWGFLSGVYELVDAHWFLKP